MVFLLISQQAVSYGFHTHFQLLYHVIHVDENVHQHVVPDISGKLQPKAPKNNKLFFFAELAVSII